MEDKTEITYYCPNCGEQTDHCKKIIKIKYKKITMRMILFECDTCHYIFGLGEGV